MEEFLSKYPLFFQGNVFFFLFLISGVFTGCLSRFIIQALIHQERDLVIIKPKKWIFNFRVLAGLCWKSE